MTKRTTTLEEAQALGFASVEECDAHEEWINENAARWAAEKAYQNTPEAQARRLKLAEANGVDPACIVWIPLDAQ